MPQIDNPLIMHTAEIVAAHVSNHNVAVSDMAHWQDLGIRDLPKPPNKNLP